MKLDLSATEFAMICNALFAHGTTLRLHDAPHAREYQALAGELPERAAKEGGDMMPESLLRARLRAQEDDKEYSTADWPATERNPSWTF